MTSLFSRTTRWAAALAVVALAAQSLHAQQGGPIGYGPPPGQQSFPASPLAGGSAAAGGGAYMDAQGRPIILPAQYATPAQYADPMGGQSMYADFGGYSMPDQVGPHYFDVAVDTVFLQNNDSFDGVGALTSVGAGGPLALTPSQATDDYEAGWKIAARLDLGPLSVLEATYMGLYDIGFAASVNSVDVAPGGVDFQLFTPFSQYGTVAPLLAGADDGQTHSIAYNAELQSTEFSYRRYWVGNNPRVSGTYLAGFRYVRLDENFRFNSVGQVTPTSVDSLSRVWAGDNEMLGFQFGGDGWLGLRQGLRIGSETKVGVYNNHYVFQNASNQPGTANDFNIVTKGDQVSFIGEANIMVVADILPSWSIRGGYQALYMSSLATAGANAADAVAAGQIDYAVVNSQGHALYHGFFGGLECIW